MTTEFFFFRFPAAHLFFSFSYQRKRPQSGHRRHHAPVENSRNETKKKKRNKSKGDRSLLPPKKTIRFQLNGRTQSRAPIRPRKRRKRRGGRNKNKTRTKQQTERNKSVRYADKAFDKDDQTQKLGNTTRRPRCDIFFSLSWRRKCRQNPVKLGTQNERNRQTNKQTVDANQTRPGRGVSFFFPSVDDLFFGGAGGSRRINERKRNEVKIRRRRPRLCPLETLEFFLLTNGSYRISLSLTRFYWVSLGFTGFYWVSKV